MYTIYYKQITSKLKCKGFVKTEFLLSELVKVTDCCRDECNCALTPFVSIGNEIFRRTTTIVSSVT